MSKLKPFHAHNLSSGWQFRAMSPQVDLPALLQEQGSQAQAEWMPAQVPGSVHQELLALQKIPDPHIACNEAKIQWVGEQDWVYRLRFDATSLPDTQQIELVFEGLDTFAHVWLNGEHLLDSDNMFVPARVSVKERLRAQGNELLLVFDAALRRGREQEALFGRRQLWNGDSSRLYVRKAGYHYGWDWGPVILSAGPWKPIRLHAWDAKISDIHSRIMLSAGLDAARVDVRVQIEAQASAQLTAHVQLLDPLGTPVCEATGPVRDGVANLAYSVMSPQLWWPHTMGDQPLYTQHTTLLDAQGQVLQRDTRRLGMRRIRLVQEPVAGEAGSSFYFEVNNRALFTGGANWIPDDNLLTRIEPARYRARVKQAVDGNMSMLRVWGGGIYEDEAFYDACDELGVLVWQDFLFACGMYPAHDEFLKSVRAEAQTAVRRLRHRASLAIWCGNNEDYAVAESIGQYGAGKDMAKFDGRTIYENLLPGVCAALDPDRPYWPGSPYSPCATGTLSSSDPTVGDRHSWEVWHVNMLPYQDYHKVQSRFISEFGMQSHPSLPLLERVIPAEEQFPNSRTLTWHNKAGPTPSTPDGHRRLAVYMSDNLRVPDTLAGHVYATQFVQAEAMRYAYQDFRSRWQTSGARAVGGALVWQLNDCWPVTSWAIIDSDGSPKPAWHTIRRAMAPIAVALRAQAPGFQCTLMSDRDHAVAGVLHFKLYSHEGQCLHAHSMDCTAQANTSTAIPLQADGLQIQGQPVVAEVTFISKDKTLQARDVAWPEPFRYYPLDLAGIRLEREPSSSSITLSAERPVKGVWLQSAHAQFADNFVDVLPGEAVRIPTQGPLEAPIRVWALNQAELYL